MQFYFVPCNPDITSIEGKMAEIIRITAKKGGEKMANRSNKVLLPEAKQALDSFKYEVASELGLSSKVQSSGWSNMTSKECGAVGGEMVKKMIAQAQSSMVGKTK